MKAKHTRKGNIQITLTEAENNTLNQVLRFSHDFNVISYLRAFSKDLLSLEVKPRDNDAGF